MRPVFGELIREQKKRIARQAILDLKTIKTRRQMTIDEIRAALVLEKPTYLPGSPDKRFAYSIAGIAKTSQQITEAQAAYLWRMVYRYRRQIKDVELVELAEERKI